MSEPENEPSILEGKRKFAGLLESSPLEEEIHQFFNEHSWLFRQPLRERRGYIEGFLSKFPITPDRIPDFTALRVELFPTQLSNLVSLIELKRPGCSLFTKSGRMSQELNDAWMECIESLRLLGSNYQDFLRRAVEQVDAGQIQRFDRSYNALTQSVRDSLDDPFPYRQNAMHLHMPWFNCVIIIGRRRDLTSAEMLRLQEMSHSTRRTIEIVTYDAILENIVEHGEKNCHWWFW